MPCLCLVGFDSLCLLLTLFDASAVLLSSAFDVVRVCAVCMLVVVTYDDVAVDAVVVILVILRLSDPLLPDAAAIVDNEEVDVAEEEKFVLDVLLNVL